MSTTADSNQFELNIDGEELKFLRRLCEREIHYQAARRIDLAGVERSQATYNEVDRLRALAKRLHGKLLHLHIT